MNRNLLFETNGTVGNRVPSGWAAYGGLLWKSLNLAVGIDWAALQVRGNIVEQAIAGCLFTNTGDQTRWLRESYDTLVADRWALVSNNGGVWVLVKGDRMVSGIPVVDKGTISASVVFMSAGTSSDGNTAGQTWTAVSNSRFDYSIRTIAYGNNRFVAGGDSGRMATSTDGVTWTPVPDSKFGADDINGIAYCNNRFFAVGDDGKMRTSTDGTNWTAVNVYPGMILKADGVSRQPAFNVIAYGNGKFVVSFNGYIATSTNGTTWTAVPDSKFGYDNISAIAFGNNRFVAVGDRGRIATSTDGTNWAAVSNSRFGTSSIYAIAFGNGKFVAVGDSGKMASSTDGTNWTAVSDSKFGYDHIFAIAYGNNKFVAVGSNGKMATSTDGTNWTAVSDSKFGTGDLSIIFTIAYGNNKFVAGGAYGKMAFSTN
jgi:photosystem II stability/assembly factor-like uncharacterized protein